MSHREYMRLLSPGVEWLLRCLGDYGALADARALPLPTADGSAAAVISGKDIFQDVLTSFREHCNDNMVRWKPPCFFPSGRSPNLSPSPTSLSSFSSTQVLAHIIGCFSAAYYAHAVLGMVTLIKAPTLAGRGHGDPNVAWVHIGAQSVFQDVCTDTLGALGRRLIDHPPPEDQKKTLLSEVRFWRFDFISVASRVFLRALTPASIRPPTPSLS